MKMNKYIDLAAISNLVIVLVGWLPAMAAGLTVLWYLYKFYGEIRNKWFR